MNDEDIKQTAGLLSRLSPGFLPYPVFEQIARIVALPIVEFIPLRFNNDEVEVLLIKRDDDDPFWPGLFHTPGTVIRATDLAIDQKDNWKAFERISKDELKGTNLGIPHYVGSIYHQSKRGAEQAQLYWVEVNGSPKIGSFFKFDSLPDNLIESQIKFINEAANNFIKHKNSESIQRLQT